jgi:hypothetical protein
MPTVFTYCPSSGNVYRIEYWRGRPFPTIRIRKLPPCSYLLGISAEMQAGNSMTVDEGDEPHTLERAPASVDPRVALVEEGPGPIPSLSHHSHIPLPGLESNQCRPSSLTVPRVETCTRWSTGLGLRITRSAFSNTRLAHTPWAPQLTSWRAT